MAKGPAMTREQAVATLETGIEVAEAHLQKGTGIFGTGEMGIGNTTPSTTPLPLFIAVTGSRKCAVAEQASTTKTSS